jgi:hypothetical protein
MRAPNKSNFWSLGLFIRALEILVYRRASVPGFTLDCDFHFFLLPFPLFPILLSAISAATRIDPTENVGGP